MNGRAARARASRAAAREEERGERAGGARERRWEAGERGRQHGISRASARPDLAECRGRIPLSRATGRTLVAANEPVDVKIT